MIKYFKVTNRNQHRGSALIIALFIIIVMSLLGTALVNMQSTSSEAIAQEVLSTRALAAARTGAQRHLTLLFPLNGSVNTTICPTTNSVVYNQNFTKPTDLGSNAPYGLVNCSVSVSCENYATNTTTTPVTQYYRITSSGTCGEGTINSSSNSVISSRTIQIEARGVQ